MRIIDTGITKEVLSGDNFPQLKIGDKLYTVDNRQKTWDKINEIQSNNEFNEKEKTKKIYDLALGEEARKEIEEMNLPVEHYTFLTYCVMGAITGEEPKKLQELARNSKNL